MGSVVIIFLPILLPLIIILGTAEKLGYDPANVLFAPFGIFIEIIIKVFFGGSEEAFFSFLDSFFNEATDFITENRDEIVVALTPFAELLYNLFDFLT